MSPVTDPGAPGYRALATLYNALMTGLVLSLISRHGGGMARDFVHRLFRHQHLEKFLPGVRKPGLDGEPHAVACALYHYHSNALGGVKTEYLRESDRKAWIRYPPPRWIWKGAAICAVPREVNDAMLHGWHGHNGVSLGNFRLGFVCTGQTVEGDPGLEGYARYLGALLAAQGGRVFSNITMSQAELVQDGWRPMRGVAFADAGDRAAALCAWAKLWQGALAAYNRRLGLTFCIEGYRIVWRVA